MLKAINHIISIATYQDADYQELIHRDRQKVIRTGILIIIFILSFVTAVSTTWERYKYQQKHKHFKEQRKGNMNEVGRNYEEVDLQQQTSGEQMEMQTKVNLKYSNDQHRQNKMHTKVLSKKGYEMVFWMIFALSSILIQVDAKQIEGTRHVLPCDFESVANYCGKEYKIKYSNPYQEVCKEAYMVKMIETTAGTIINCNLDSEDKAASKCIDTKTPGKHDYNSQWSNDNTDAWCLSNYHTCRYRELNKFEMYKGLYCIQQFQGFKMPKQLGNYTYVVHDPMLEYKRGYFYINSSSIYEVETNMQLGTNSAVVQTDLTSYFNDFKECFNNIKKGLKCAFTDETVLYLLQVSNTPQAPTRGGTEQSPALEPIFPTVVQRSCNIDVTFERQVDVIVKECIEGDYIAFDNMTVSIRSEDGCRIGNYIVSSMMQNVNYVAMHIKFLDNCKFSMQGGEIKPSIKCKVAYFKDIQGRESHKVDFIEEDGHVEGFFIILVSVIIAMVILGVILYYKVYKKTDFYRKRIHKQKVIKKKLEEMGQEELMQGFDTKRMSSINNHNFNIVQRNRREEKFSQDKMDEVFQ